MGNEEAGSGFLSRLKNVFSTVQTVQEVEVVKPATQSTTMPVENMQEEPAPRFSPEENVTEMEITLRRVEVSAPTYTLPTEKDLDIRFATNFVGAGGKFIFCENLKEAVEGLKMLKQEKNWSHIFCWENEIKDAFCDSGFQKGALGFTIENSDAAVSLCETLVADEGTILLNPKQASRRRLPCFPKTHVILTDVAHLTATEADGLEKFYQLYKGELPSVIKLGECNNGHFYDKARLILNAEGPEDIYVFLVDEIIPPSLRP
jgi:L-lactate dehydrogenase complex protein LldG